jgi:hypothetical protein
MKNFYPILKPDPERRVINGVEYIVDYYPCNCSCHSTGAIHIMACCNGGWIESFRKVTEEPNDLGEINEL